MRRLIVCVVAFWCALGAVLPVSAQTSEETDAPIATGDDAPNDLAIDQRIERILDQMEGLEAVYVLVRSGVVTLRGRVAEKALADEAESIARRVEGVVAVKNEIGEVTSYSERFVPAWERLRNRVKQIVAQLPLIGLSVLVFLVIFALGMWVTSRPWPWSRMAPNSFIAHLLRQAMRLVFIGVAAVVALDIAGASALLGTVLGAAGLVGLAVGFAVRDTVENYIASILLSLRQPFHPNDWVSVDSHEGSVIMLTSRATILMDAGGNHIRIPNSTVFKGVVHNYSRNPERRFDFQLGIDPDANLRGALDLGIATIAAQAFTLTRPGPDAWIDDVGDSTVTVTFTGWVNQTTTSFVQARSEAIRLVKLALEREGYRMPEPAFRLRFESETPALPAGKGKGKAAKPTSADQAETSDAGDTAADKTVEQRVAEERANSGASDLLDSDAKQEI